MQASLKRRSLMWPPGRSARLLFSAIALAMLALVAPNAKASPPESMPVWRAQLLIRTADVSDAGTDDGVKVQLNSRNVTWLDYERDDFKRNDVFTYDLAPVDIKNPGAAPTLSRLSDLTKLEISKTGTDGLCIREIDLRINGRSIYREVFSAPGLWLDNDNGHSRVYAVSSSRLRQNSHWLTYPAPVSPQDLPLLITHGEMESRIESLAGTFIHDNSLYWGHLHGRAVEVTKKDDHTLHVDLDLAAGVTGPNPEIDVDMDVGISCSSGSISLAFQNVHAEADYLGLFSKGKDLQSFTVALSTGQPLCPLIAVGANGDINLGIPVPPAPRRRVTVTFLNVKVTDNLFPSAPANLAFGFGMNSQFRRYPAAGTQTFALGQSISLPASLNTTEVMASGTLWVTAGTNLHAVIHENPKTGEPMPAGVRRIEVRRSYASSANFGRGIHTERSTVDGGFFEVTYRIDVQD